MRTHMPVSVSLPPDLFAAAEKRAAELGFKRATYIQQLILADLRRQKSEGGGGGFTLASSNVAPRAGARQGKAGAGKAAAKKAAKPVKKAPAAKKKKGRR